MGDADWRVGLVLFLGGTARNANNASKPGWTRGGLRLICAIVDTKSFRATEERLYRDSDVLAFPASLNVTCHRNWQRRKFW